VLINVAARSDAAVLPSHKVGLGVESSGVHTPRRLSRQLGPTRPTSTPMLTDEADKPSVRLAPADLHPAALAYHRSLLAVLCAPLVGTAAGRRRGAGRAWQLRSRSIVQTALATRRRLSACVACFHT
jgi:hypothetical protein